MYFKAARRDAIAYLKSFWGPGHQLPNFDGFIYVHYAASPYSAGIGAIYVRLFVRVPFVTSVCDACNGSEVEC